MYRPSHVDYIELHVPQATELLVKDGGNSMDVSPAPLVCPQEKDAPYILASNEYLAPITPPTPNHVENVSGPRNLHSKRVVALWQHRVEGSDHLAILYSG
ncbi:hypothetical protein RHMOL_Rhmol07G0196400 [Rhododendron molle]|uniref:Uncharacterized protein n=1 Tax=Rhododendron molle TaxID=49168 RepID=A0ACC0N2A2_RHOML|nr:hypothetical protein RHMOL_Rhmol07G0196400 [Rhododendron molle]